MKGKKIILLTLALILPIAVFIFLKMFGRNEFNVPVMYQKGAIKAPGNCGFSYRTPYVIPDSVSTALEFSPGDSLNVIYFDPSLSEHINRISSDIKGNAFKIITPAQLAVLKMDTSLLKQCIFLMDPDQSVILVDNHNRLRGYYNGSDRDEMDRLIIEMNIILKRY
jgi:hypothetical protein